jgi:hypothetical protein
MNSSPSSAAGWQVKSRYQIGEKRLAAADDDVRLTGRSTEPAS